VVQRLVVHLPAQAGGDRLHRLAPAVQHQPAQVALAAGALILAWQRLEDIGSERLQAPADGGQLGWCDAPHSSPSGGPGGRIHSHTTSQTQT
jgi:hypothetical protein